MAQVGPQRSGRGQLCVQVETRGVGGRGGPGGLPIAYAIGKPGTFWNYRQLLVGDLGGAVRAF